MAKTKACVMMEKNTSRIRSRNVTKPNTIATRVGRMTATAIATQMRISGATQTGTSGNRQYSMKSGNSTVPGGSPAAWAVRCNFNE